MPRWHQHADVVVIGTGVAGLMAALTAHRRGSRVVVLAKETPDHGSRVVLDLKVQDIFLRRMERKPRGTGQAEDRMERDAHIRGHG